MNRNYYIKNLACNKSILINNKYNNFITDILSNIKLYKKKDYNFNILNLKIKKNNLFSFEHNETYFYLKFCSKLMDSALFFNIIIKENNKLYILKFKNYNLLEKNKHQIIKYKLKKDNIDKIKYIKNKDYLFYFSYKNTKLCKIKQNNNFFLKYYVKIPIIRTDINKNNNTYCKLNSDNINIVNPINDNNINCKFLKINNKNNKNNKISKLDKCIINNTNFLKKKLPIINNIIKKFEKKIYIINAGDTNNNIQKNEDNINNRMNDSLLKQTIFEAKYSINESYKIILGDIIDDLSIYLTTNNINHKTHDIKNLSKTYTKIILDIKEHSREYNLSKKYNICKNTPIQNYCSVNNILSCQKLCNNNDDCRFISYSKKTKECNLYDKCNLKNNTNYDTYIRKSLLRNQGYNWYNRFLLNRNKPIYPRPFYLDLFLLIFATIFIISLVSVLSRLIIIFIKYFYCFIYSDQCYYPNELFTLNENKSRYI